MPEVGLEPTWGCPRQILSLVRIPISPLRRELQMIRLRQGKVKTGSCLRQPMLALAEDHDLVPPLRFVQKRLDLGFDPLLGER